MEKTESALRGIIDANGPEYLSKKPWETYEALIAGKVSGLQARLVLVTLLAEGAEKARTMPPDALSRHFQRSCSLRKAAADEIAAMYGRLFSRESQKRWQERTGDGFRSFCDGAWPVEWEGEAQWRPGNVYMDCWASVRAAIRVADAKLAHKQVVKLEKDNPFVGAERIRKTFEQRISSELDDELESYVTAERYYQPVMEDFPSECAYSFERICAELGLASESFACEASGSDLLPEDW